MVFFSQLRERHRYVAFIDVSDSVGLYRRLGDPVAQARIATALKSASGCVEHSHGRIVKQSGDEILCLFKQARDVVAAVSRVQSAARHVEFRIGVHVGNVLLKRQDVFGDVVNMASRLTSIARARQILISRDVLDRLPVRERERCRWYDELRVRGCDTHFSIYQVRWEPDLETVANTIPAQFAPQPRTLVLESSHASWELDPHRGPITIGRDGSCGIVLDGERISRQHGRFEFRRGKLVYSDSSTNGTYILEKGALEETYVRREEIPLGNCGVISLGVPVANQQSDNLLSYIAQ